VTAAADLDKDGIYEQKYKFPQQGIISVTIVDDRRVFLRDKMGGLSVYFDKKQNCTYEVTQDLMISGTKNFSIPSPGRLIIEGNDGSIAVYQDKDSDGIYEISSIFGMQNTK
jgi:hypothetical protein